MKYIVTGTSSGLGYCLAERLVSHGHVVGVSRKVGRADALFKTGIFKHIEYDFSLESNVHQLNNLLDELQKFLSNEPFTLVLNAACFYSGVERLHNSALKGLFEVNVFSLMMLVEKLNNVMLRRVFIVNSISGLVGQSDQHEYSASKHAVMGFARSLAKSAKNSNYDVMCINPGGMKTELWVNYGAVNTTDFLSPELVATVCESLILFPQRAFIESMSILPPSDV